MLGGEFVTHGAIVDAEVRVAEPADPAFAHLTPTFRITDACSRLTLSPAAQNQVLLNSTATNRTASSATAAPAPSD